MKKTINLLKSKSNIWLPVSMMAVAYHNLKPFFSCLNLYEKHCEMVFYEWMLDKKLKNFPFYLFITLEPCLMCFGALIKLKLKGLFFSVRNEKSGFLNFVNTKSLSYYIKGNILENDYKLIIKNFFKKKLRRKII